MLRALLALLLLANGLFLAWTQGGLAPMLPPPGAAEREPQRLAAQVNPGQVRVLSPQAASEALTAAQAEQAAEAAAAAQRRCLEAGPFDAAARVEAESLLSAAGLDETRWQRLPPAPAEAPQARPAAPPPDTGLLRVNALDDDERSRLLALSLPGAGFRPCAPR